MTETRKILIVEDEVITAMDLKTILEESGYVVVGIATTGHEAIHAALLNKPNLIIMDVLLKDDVNAFEVANLLKEHQIPIVFLTACADQDTFEQAKLCEPYAYLVKPFQTQALKNAVDLALHRHNLVLKHTLDATYFQHAFLFAGNGIGLYAINDKFLKANQYLCQLLNYTEEELSCLSLKDIIFDPDYELQQINLRRLLDNTCLVTQAEVRLMNKSNHIIWVNLTASLVSVNNQPIYYILQVQDITNQKLAQKHSLSLPDHDSVTGLAKRSLLENFVNKTLNTAPKQHMLALYFINIDHFKHINEVAGREVGDKLLLAIGNRLTSLISPHDFAARLENDEFIIVITNLPRAEHAQHMANKILKSFDKPFEVKDDLFNLSASIGITLYPQDGKDIQSLMRKADIAVQHAKDEGGNRFVFSKPEITKKVELRLAMETRLRQALKNKDFMLNFQPKINLATQVITGVETLLRLKGYQRSVIPIDLILVAEKTGLIFEIGMWVLKAACIKGAQWQRQGYDLSVAVNLSPMQFYDFNLINQIKFILKETNFNPELLEFEITESMIMKNLDLSKKRILQMKEEGIKIAIDDFGTGYSSLNYLQYLPVDTIKIDRTFLLNSDNPQGAALLNTIISLGHLLKLKVVAEGIENAEQFTLLKNIGCDEAQGFYIARPLSSRSFTKFYQNFTQHERHLGRVG